MGSTLYTRRYESTRAGRKRKIRPKTFQTEEAAHAWAKTNKVADYELKVVRQKTSKFKTKIQVVPK